MANEVEIVVVSRDRTDFAPIRAKAKTAGDGMGKDLSTGVEKGLVDLRKSGEKAAEGLGKDLVKGSEKGLVDLGEKVGPAVGKVGLSMGSSLASSLESTLSSTGPGGAAVTAALIGVGAAAAPLLGAALSGAIIGGAAVGGVLGGLMLVKDNPAVRGAAQAAGDSIMNDLKGDANVFVEPAVRGIAIIKSSFQSANSDISAIFAKSATFVEPLASAVGDVIPKITSGLNALVQGATPVISALSDGIKMVGSAIGDGFKELSNDGVAAGTAIAAIFAIVTASIKTAFVAVDALTKTFGFFAEHGLLGPGIKAEFDALQDGAKKSSASLDQVKTSADSATDALHGLAAALKAQTDPAFALIDAQNTLTKAQASYNEALKEHGAQSQQAKDANVALAKAALGVESATEGAGDALNGKMTPALVATLRAAGVSESAIAALGRQFDSSATQGKNFAKTYTAKVQLEGVDNVRQMAAEAKSFISSIPSIKTITIQTNYVTIGKPVSTSAGATGIGGGNYTGHAAGGVVGSYGHAAEGGARSNLTLVGEQGPELVNLAPGSTVTSAPQTQTLLNGSGGGASITVNFYVQGSIRSDRDFVALIRDEFQRGGFRGVVSAA